MTQKSVYVKSRCHVINLNKRFKTHFFCYYRHEIIGILQFFVKCFIQPTHPCLIIQMADQSVSSAVDSVYIISAASYMAYCCGCLPYCIRGAVMLRLAMNSRDLDTATIVDRCRLVCCMSSKQIKHERYLSRLIRSIACVEKLKDES